MGGKLGTCRNLCLWGTASGQELGLQAEELGEVGPGARGHAADDTGHV